MLSLTTHPIPVIATTTSGGFEIHSAVPKPPLFAGARLRLLTLLGEFSAVVESWLHRHMSIEATIWALERLRDCVALSSTARLVVAIGDGDPETLTEIEGQLAARGMSTIETKLPTYPKELRLYDGHPNAEGQRRLAEEIARGLTQIGAVPPAFTADR